MKFFFLGYGSNEHAYRVFNKTSRRVEVAVDVTFDESNGSQVEQVDSSVVGKEDPPCEAIKQLAIGDIRPQEDEVTEVVVPQVDAAPISADVPDATLQQASAATPERGSATLEGGSAAPTQLTAADSTPAHGQDLQPIFEQDDDEDPEDEQEAVKHPRLRQTIQRDHPIDNILGSLRKG